MSTTKKNPKRATTKRATTKKNPPAPSASSEFILPAGHTLMLRTCAADMTSNEGTFTWPREGLVECPRANPDHPMQHWQATKACGNGLHGFLRGVGDSGLADWGETAVWVVAEIVEAEAIDLNGKVKVPRAWVRFAGDRGGALELMRKHSQLAPGHFCERVGTDGYRGAASATGDQGAASATGEHGLALTSYRGQVGKYGTLIIKYKDEKAGRWRVKVGYAGEDGIEAGGWYQLSASGEFVRVESGGPAWDERPQPAPPAEEARP